MTITGKVKWLKSQGTGTQLNAMIPTAPFPFIPCVLVSPTDDENVVLETVAPLQVTVPAGSSLQLTVFKTGSADVVAYGTTT